MRLLKVTARLASAAARVTDAAKAATFRRAIAAVAVQAGTLLFGPGDCAGASPPDCAWNSKKDPYNKRGSKRMNENPAIQKLSPSTNPNICFASAPVKNNILVPSLHVLLPLSTGSDSGRNVGANMCAIRRLSSSCQACRRSCSVRMLLSRS